MLIPGTLLIPVLYVVGGFALLLYCADLVVRGAVSISERLNIPAILVGLTIVAFGTSAPELFISAQAVLEGRSGIALGNIVGSNITNILLVIGIPALITPIVVHQPMIRRNMTIMLMATAAMIYLAFSGQYIFRDGLILFGGLTLYLTYTAIRAFGGAKDPTIEELTEFEELNIPHSWFLAIFFLVIGLIGLPIGAHMLVEGAVVIADYAGVPEAVISISLIALGTSLPELATTIASAIRRQSDVILGNIIGSNLFNILAVLGIASMIGTIEVAPQFLNFDFWVMAASALLIAPFIYFRKDIGRLWGLLLLSLYGLYIFVLFNVLSY